ncbi:hypothetical protein PF005_g21980 [Phytophthora fragariae]|uniref:Uncharacterized protein n=1 Tax=Phytophthora fragariae TaxID=53985 RepID=A0A6A3T1F5_9STRA|nr:hypothetical protein PF003_g31875 [Phytophthora fragariae]KAE8926997.1 hypothetical protein PF009_g22828 [Phytophthora fragariae]KAE9020585.1 hypothetical protein PF011_g5343 [Phytophthora fragariae]KAE9083591.1 hypothetical protein PF010_g21162 [Phytophthora fragariae]KAE9107736.1 hypothetical protein PF006_g21035 [Phytophthora fragariae]
MRLSRTHCTFTSLSAAPLRAHDCGGATKTKRENDITCSLSQIHDKTCNLRDITCSRGGGSFLCRNLQPASAMQVV